MKICSIEVFDTSDSENNINQQDSNEKKTNFKLSCNEF